MKIKTSELSDIALDWAVAEANCRAFGKHALPPPAMPASYSTNWSQGGPIIEQERIELRWDDGVWYAAHPSYRPHARAWRSAATPLIAAMRCYVASKLGDEVDVPEELL